MVGPIPMHLNLADADRNIDSVIGWANCYRKIDGTTQIVIDLDTKASEMFKDMAEVFELKAVGFAGIARKPDGR